MASPAIYEAFKTAGWSLATPEKTVFGGAPRWTAWCWRGTETRRVPQRYPSEHGALAALVRKLWASLTPGQRGALTEALEADHG